MAGISSKAAGSLDNKYEYNGIEKVDDLGLEIYDADFRELDPQLGRWWQQDPAIEDMYSWSPYASNFDNPIRYSDPKGDFPIFSSAVNEALGSAVYFAMGFANSWLSNQLMGAGRQDITQPIHDNVPLSQRKAFAYGQLAGDFAAIYTGVEEIVAGASGEVLSIGIATPVAIPLAAHGITSIVNGAFGVGKSIAAINQLNSVGDDQINISPENQVPRDQLNPPEKAGQAPTFKKDNKKVEIHHEGQNPNGPFKEMHPQDHRGKGADIINHPNKTKKSQIDRKKFKKQRGNYWDSQYPKLPKSTLIIPKQG